MKAGVFSVVRAQSVDAAVDALETHAEAKVIAGGQSLLPLMAMRLAQPPVVVDVAHIEALRRITVNDDGSTTIGASVTQSALEAWDQLPTAQPLVAAVVPHIAHAAIRARGTVGGSLAHADPAAEWPALALTLDATIVAVSASGERRIPAAEFFDGFFTTVLDEAELLVAVELPPVTPQHHFGFFEIARRHGDFAQAGAMAALTTDGSAIAEARVVLFGVRDRPELLDHIAERIVGQRDVEDVATLVAESLADSATYASDTIGSAAFKAHLARNVTIRALTEALTSKGSIDA